MAFSLATLTRVLAATAALVGQAHAKKGADAPSPWGADYAPDVVEPGTVEGTPKPVTIFGAPTYSDKARLAADFFIRAMPLGASITQGVASTDGNGYRKYFRDQLRFNGWKVNMVGSKQDGTMNDRDNEGHPGWIIDEVYDAARSSIGLHPNLVMINVGTNDCIRNLDTGNAGARLRRLVDYLFAEIPGTTVLLSTLVPSLNDNNERCAQSVNAQYRSLVSSYGGDKRIFLADMHAFLTRSDIDPDGIHPNDGGYKKMASVWWDAFRKAEPTLQAPDNSVDDAREVSGEPSTCSKRPEQGRGPIHTQRETGYDNGGYLHKSTPRGVMATVPNLQSNTYIISQLVNAGGAPRGGEVDELVRIERQGDGSHRYSYLLNLGGRFSNAWTSFSLPACSGNVKHIFADLNNDGLDDFWCIGDRGQASVAINRGGQPPRFESIGEVIGGPGGKGPGDVLVADIDGDGRADYCVQENNGDIRCWRNGGMGDTVAYWQGFMSENTGGDVVFSRGTPNKYMVQLADINGDSRADWMYVGDSGEVDTVINQRGWGLGIKPHWRDSVRSHGGMNTPGAGAQIRFGRIFGSTRLDYVWLKPAGNNIEVEVYENIGDGGQRMKGDGTFYCDMTGSGSDDYIWVWSGGDKAELRINTHNWPNWQEGLPNLFNIQRDRRSIHLADWDGDGKCDILSQNKATGDLEMWRNEYNAQTGRFSFPYVGRVNGPASCTEGWGVNIFDRGLRLADIDGDGRADYLCLEKDGRITGALNKAGGMQNVGQIKFTEGWDRANIRFADVENGGKADMIWVNKYNGAATVLKNKGPIPAGGSAFTWEKRGVLYNSVGERGLNMNFANLGGLGRADFVKVLPRSNNADTWFNECPGGNGGGDDGAIGDPQLPPYSSNRQKASRFRRW